MWQIISDQAKLTFEGDHLKKIWPFISEKMYTILLINVNANFNTNNTVPYKDIHSYFHRNNNLIIKRTYHFDIFLPNMFKPRMDIT